MKKKLVSMHARDLRTESRVEGGSVAQAPSLVAANRSRRIASGAAATKMGRRLASATAAQRRPVSAAAAGNAVLQNEAVAEQATEAATAAMVASAAGAPKQPLEVESGAVVARASVAVHGPQLFASVVVAQKKAAASAAGAVPGVAAEVGSAMAAARKKNRRLRKL